MFEEQYIFSGIRTKPEQTGDFRNRNASESFEKELRFALTGILIK